MRISNQLLRSRAARPLYSTELIDLSHLELVSVDRLELCPKLQTLILRQNRIEAVPNLDCCPQLWKIDLANNKLRSLEGLSRFPVFGTLILSNNELDWNELLKIRHIHILDLTLHGNPLLEMDSYYRLHVIDSLPNIWMLDGRIITTAERAQVSQFFKDTALCDRPVRHKLPRNQFIPSSLKNIKVTGIHGTMTDHYMRHFPHRSTLNIDLDRRRLHYLAYNLQRDVNLDLKYTTREKVKPTSVIENLISCRKNDQERCNMLLLLLVGSLEFSIPLSLVQQTLEITRLKNIDNVNTMDLFMFSRETRCRVASLFLSAVKIERDQNIEGGLYNRLYLSLYDLVSDLVRLANGDDIARYQAVRKRFDTRKSGYRCLLASEIVQLLCIVPVFFDFIGKDPGVMDLISVATKNPDIGEQIKTISWKVQAEGGDTNKVYQEISQFLLKKTKEASSSIPNPGRGKVLDVFEKNNYPFYRMEPSYIITSKRLIVKPANQDKPQPSSKLRVRPSTGASTSPTRSARTSPARPKTGIRKPRLGDRVQLGHQACGRLVALPENHVGLVQIDTKAASRFQQADYSLHSKFDDQFYYVNFRHMEWDPKVAQWRFASGFSELSLNAGNRRTTETNEEETRFLSEILQQSLKLRADLPFTQKETPEEQDDKREGHVLITDHVRSIVRECLQEAEVEWPDEEKPLNPEATEIEQTWTEPERVESPVSQSEVTVHVDSDSFTASHDLQVVDEESAEPSEVQEHWNVNERIDAPIPRSTPYKTFMRVSHLINVDMYQPNERYHHLHPSREGDVDRDPVGCSVHEEEMVSSTENARLEAWKSYELIKRDSSSGFPSRVGSATSKHTPPQRPSTPLHSNPV
ncbi:uncharacterized protein LOC116297119, partial [Actinia tenebrosa]|uniref:Uncharacterized protein LOC116297119 n=1 Tax=Actinia tenebrosa TaxID=6105 RepID=A0A6P8I0T6_ACTTE